MVKEVHMGQTKNIAEKYENATDKLPKMKELANSKYSNTTLKNPPKLAALKLQDVLMKTAGGKICEDKWHTIEIAELRKTPTFKTMTLDEMADLLADIQTTVIRVDTHQSIKQFHLLSMTALHKDEDGKIGFRFDEYFRELMNQSDIYAVLDYQTSLALNSRYSHRLHDMIALRANLEKTKERFTVENMRAHLGVQTGKLKLWSQFKAKALEPAIAELNQSSRFDVEYRVTKKERRAITEIEITWKIKDSFKEAKKEQKAHSIARKGRAAINKIDKADRLNPEIAAALNDLKNAKAIKDESTVKAITAYLEKAGHGDKI